MRRLFWLVLLGLVAQVVWAKVPTDVPAAAGEAAATPEEAKKNAELCQQLEKKRDEAADERGAQVADKRLREMKAAGKCDMVNLEAAATEEKPEPATAAVQQEAAAPVQQGDAPAVRGEVRIGGEASLDEPAKEVKPTAVQTVPPEKPQDKKTAVRAVQPAQEAASTLEFLDEARKPSETAAGREALIETAQMTVARQKNALVTNAQGDVGWMAYNKKSKKMEFVPATEVAKGVPVGYHPNDKGGGFGDHRAAAGNLKDHAHQGQDWMARPNTEVFSSTPGTVVKIGQGGGNFGNRVWIDYGQGQIGYAHLKSINPDLRVGDHVALGDWLGVQGNSGAEWSVSHLHLETRGGVVGNVWGFRDHRKW
jgi:murein DD-endopeptidase MepM/ murein hydrolase activator NlpD